MQPFSSDWYFKCLLREFEWAGIDYEIIGSESLRMSGIEPSIKAQNSI